MRCFFFNPALQTADTIRITGSEARHISTVLRMKPGNRVELFNGTGEVVQAEILQCRSREVVFSVLSRAREAEPHTALTVAQAMLKGKKMDFLVQKMTELGVHTFVPVISQFCEKRVQDKRLLDRWYRIMYEACKQCRRPVPMEIKQPLSFDSLQVLDSDCKIIASENENTTSFQPESLLSAAPSAVTLLIGPEGGFHGEEVEKALQNDFISISLGSRILRAETAAIVAVSLIQHACHNLDPLSG